MTREWKPGDVAFGQISEYEGRFVFRGEHDGWDGIDEGGEEGWDGEFIGNLRPLVVIDPEDREQVERLAKAMHESDHIAPWHDLHHETRGAMEDAMQAALRSLIPPPKPEEPTGLGAVVEDAEGKRYVRHDGFLAPWRRSDVPDAERPWRYYSGIDAVRVLSEGVQA